MAEAQFWIGIHGIIAEGGRLLVLKRAPRMVYRPGNWDLPGGHLAINENLEECLLREIDEETGLEVAIERMLGLNKMPNGPYVQALYACRPLGTRREIRLRPQEHVEARWMTLDELATIESRIPYLETILKRGLLDYLR